MIPPEMFHLSKIDLYLFVTTFVLLVARTAAKIPNLSSDESSLASLKRYIASDPNLILVNGWSDTIPVCNWTGVTCHGNPPRVIGLNLSYGGLVGTVSPNLGNMSSLVHLSLANNSFHGPLPSELSRLSRLKTMDFGFNSLTGRIPTWLGSLLSLERLFLPGNRFSGSIPAAICNSTSLRIINLSDNLLSGEIPQEIGDLRWLEKLSIQRNSLSGALPQSLFNMSSLKLMVFFENRFTDKLPDNLCQRLPAIQGLDLSENRLSGPIPSKLWQCRELYYLGLDSNEFIGEIPTNIGNLTSLKLLHLSNNTLSGAIPEEIGKLQKLQVLDLNGNELSGSIPASIFNITTIEAVVLSANPLSGLKAFNLKALQLFNNQLTGPLPKSIANASQLTTLEISHNRFSGSIPDLSALTNLNWLNLEDNDFTVGSDDIFLALSAMRKLRVCALTFNPLNVTLPASFGSNISDSLQQLDVAICDLRGHIPATIANLSSLILLSLAKNKFSGEIPASIGKLERLQVLHLNRNKLRGSIPSEVCQLKSLFRLQLHQNMLSGSIPPCFTNIGAALRYLNLGYNRLTSTIPQTIWGLDYLLGIDLSSNFLVGPLSSNVGNLKVATYFDISNNRLSGNISRRIGELGNVAYMSLANNKFVGSIPDSLGNLISLLVLDLSNNNLTGEIPKSMEKLLKLRALNLSFNDLYGVIPSGGPFWNFSSQSFMRNHALCGAPRLQVSPCKIASRKGNKARVLRIVVPCLVAALVLATLFVIVISRRKRNTNPDTEATLASWRGITRFELSAGTNGFSEENLLGKGSFGSVYKGTLSDGLAVAIKVFNWASEEAFASFERECEVLSNIRHRNLVKVITCCSSPDFKALVLEYMPQGSLEEWLYSDDDHGRYLNISQRLSIAIDVASAIEYLHHGYPNPIVHCDLKPSNVLLDENMVARVADFGIAKLLSGQNSMTHTRTLATIGYIAPEYGASGAVSRKGDVYSFGIMLMEIFTRKKPVDEMFSEEMSLRQWVENSVPHSITQVIEAGLLRNDETSMKECLCSLMELALSCSASTPEERLDIITVASTLRKIDNKYF